MSDSPVNKVTALLKFEDAPPFGGGAMPVEKEKTFVLLAHIFTWIIWLWKRRESPAVDAHGKEATNFFLTMLCFIIPLQIVITVLATVLPGFLLTLISLVMGLVGLAFLALAIFAGLKAQEGKLLRYPINFRFIK